MKDWLLPQTVKEISVYFSDKMFLRGFSPTHPETTRNIVPRIGEWGVSCDHHRLLEMDNGDGQTGPLKASVSNFASTTFTSTFQHISSHVH